eukprot:CAMPEP_0115243188 /NCGR_PEP_ID=MMETSP0270-20121206/39344_1 /TAXON_ID=71861 /ORGANISM="Scrippsiella trochoidea, Strain CCMP3099" /LENGTH=449 /DNA_ID=CAMNT_0002658287 /DNA_START=66 /DNA_END=1415 /DNA_ORIENTATION=+
MAGSPSWSTAASTPSSVQAADGGSSPDAAAGAAADAKMNRLVAAQLTKTKICAMFARGSCTETACRFAHSPLELRSPPDLTKTAICRAFQRGQCRDSGCKFAHGEQELRCSPSVYKTQICHFFDRGHCKKGNRCRHAHGAAELRSFEGSESSTESAGNPSDPGSRPPSPGKTGGCLDAPLVSPVPRKHQALAVGAGLSGGVDSAGQLWPTPSLERTPPPSWRGTRNGGGTRRATGGEKTVGGGSAAAAVAITVASLDQVGLRQHLHASTKTFPEPMKVQLPVPCNGGMELAADVPPLPGFYGSTDSAITAAAAAFMARKQANAAYAVAAKFAAVAAQQDAAAATALANAAALGPGGLQDDRDFHSIVRSLRASMAAHLPGSVHVDQALVARAAATASAEIRGPPGIPASGPGGLREARPPALRTRHHFDGNAAGWHPAINARTISPWVV